MTSTSASSWLAQRAAVSANQPALIQSDETLSFGQLRARSRTIALELVRNGVVPGGRVGLLMDNGFLFAECLHGLMDIGAVCVPLNERLRPEEQKQQLDQAAATMLLFDTAHSKAAGKIGVERAVELEAGRGLHIGKFAAHGTTEAEAPAHTQSTDALHTIMFTSGTTGASSGVELTYANHWWSAFGSMLNLGNLESDVWLGCLSPSHVGGLAILLRSVLYGVPVMLHNRFEPEEVNAALDSGRVTMVSLVSTMLHRMLELRDNRPYPATLRCVLLGGGPIPASLVEACMDAHIPIAPTYGLTETASQVATLKPRELSERPRSAGRPLFGVQMRIDGQDGEGSSAPGEIMVRGPQVSPRYCSGRPTARCAGGWLPTGDVGTMDEAGYLYVLDRRTDRIVTGGENVYPREVESVLEAYPGIAEAGVVGVADAEWGQMVTAAVVLREAEVDEESIVSWCRDRLAGFKWPRRIHIVDSLPRTTSGKLMRHELTRQLTEKSS